MFERHVARKLRQFLKHFDENHLAKVLLRSSSRSMGADHFCDNRIKTMNQFTSGSVIMPERSRNQHSFISRVHVAEVASTLLTKTAPRTLRLRKSTKTQTPIGLAAASWD